MNDMTESGTTAVAEAPAVDIPQLAPVQKKKWLGRKKQDNKRFTKKRFPVGKLFFVLLVAGAGIFAYVKLSNKGPEGLPVSMSPLEKGQLVNSVSLTGNVESANDAEVYAKGSGAISKIYVNVGDRVEAGQMLAQLDTRDYQLEIAQREASIEQQKRNNEFTIRTSEKDFNAERVDIAAGLNQELIAAENAVDRAQTELNAARRDYNDYKDGHELADIVFKRAQRELERTSDKFRDAKRRLEEAKTSELTIEQREELETYYKEAEEAFLKASDAYNQADREYGSEMSSEARAYRDARNNYEKALKDRDAVKNSIVRRLDDLKDNVEKAELNMDFTADYLLIDQLQQKISDSAVTAPIAGTITAVYAKEGASAGGPLFIIEDTDNLVIKTTIKELDVAKIKPQMDAEIKADATGEKVFPGVVQSISPTAVKDANGKTVTSGNVEFDADVSLTEADEDLRVGMNVRVSIVTEQKDKVFFVPFDAVATDEEGNSILYTIETDAEGISHAKSIPVTTGMETDFYIEVSGTGLKEGLPIISDASTMEEGLQVIEQEAAQKDSQSQPEVQE